MQNKLLFTNMEVKLKNQEYFEKNSNFTIKDIQKLKSFFNKRVKIRIINLNSNTCIVDGILDRKWYPTDFELFKKGSTLK